MKRQIWFVMILGTLLTACSLFTSSAQSDEEKIKEMLTGQQAVVFGSEEFTTGSKSDLESYGMIVQTASDLKSAIPLAGEVFVEFHCVNDDGITTIVQANKPANILWNGEDPITECVRGVIFINFYTTNNPDVIAP